MNIYMMLMVMLATHNLQSSFGYNTLNSSIIRDDWVTPVSIRHRRWYR
jgi:hypothetical protein